VTKFRPLNGNGKSLYIFVVTEELAVRSLLFIDDEVVLQLGDRFIGKCEFIVLKWTRIELDIMNQFDNKVK
jgi:hypothetical protein